MRKTVKKNEKFAKEGKKSIVKKGGGGELW